MAFDNVRGEASTWSAEAKRALWFFLASILLATQVGYGVAALNLFSPGTDVVLIVTLGAAIIYCLIRTTTVTDGVNHRPPVTGDREGS